MKCFVEIVVKVGEDVGKGKKKTQEGRSAHAMKLDRLKQGEMV